MPPLCLTIFPHGSLPSLMTQFLASASSCDPSFHRVLLSRVRHARSPRWVQGSCRSAVFSQGVFVPPSLPATHRRLKFTSRKGPVTLAQQWPAEEIKFTAAGAWLHRFLFLLLHLLLFFSSRSSSSSWQTSSDSAANHPTMQPTSIQLSTALSTRSTNTIEHQHSQPL